MERWVVFALISMVFAGMTSVVAKQGLVGISGELGLFVRTVFVFILIVAFAAVAVPVQELRGLQRSNYVWLGISGITTAVSWVFYYKALKIGDVSGVGLIDKGSVVIAILLAWLFLHEAITPRIIMGAVLVIGGVVLISRK